MYPNNYVLTINRSGDYKVKEDSKQFVAFILLSSWKEIFEKKFIMFAICCTVLMEESIY